MYGIRNNCELVHAYLGAYAGLFTAFLQVMGAIEPVNSAEGVQLSLLTATFAAMFITFQFVVVYRQRLWVFLFSILLPAVIYGFVVYAVMVLTQIPYLQPLVMFTIGLLIGIALGRVLCAACVKGTKTLTHMG